ncbi:MAG: ATP-binding protein [Campylobacterales bacterium]|nr:ATP-binding protein [Campylobacterales bacterium]
MAARVQEAVEIQRHRDRQGMQRSMSYAMDEMVRLVGSRWREPLQRLAALHEEDGPQSWQLESAALIATSMLQSLEEWEEFFRIDTAREAVELSGSVRSALPRIEVECYETGQFIVIRLCDNAGGVDAGIVDRIFEPYFSTKSRAAGLGLYMARNIVEEHCNGELTFDNIDEGACFCLKIGKHQAEERE